jgi:hypothetical protein
MNNFAPVLIATLNRHVHFRRCIESLAACTHADETILYIAFDYPLNESHREGYEIIRAYLPNIKGFKTVNIIEREKNFGVRNNFVDAREKIFKNYDRMILSEDDNVFAPSFLDFVNKGLDVYENREDIFSVSGYNSPFPMPEWYDKDAYLLENRFTAWGVGIWREKWNKVNGTVDYCNDMLSDPDIYKILKKHYMRFLPQLLRIIDTRIITGDGLLLLYLIQNKMSSVFPVKTRVRNTGHDGSGVHCGNGGIIYMNQEIYEGNDEPYLPNNIKLDKRLNQYLLKQIQPTLKQRITYYLPPAVRAFLRKLIKRR